MDIEIPYWINLILYIITGTGGATGLVLLGKKLRSWIRMRAFLRGVREIHQTYSALLSIQNDTKARCALILKSENGGGTPRAGHRLYATVVYETYTTPFVSIKDAWDRRELGRWYIKMLDQLLEGDPITIYPDKIDINEQLRDSYIAGGVIKSEMVALGYRDNAFWYLALHYDRDIDFKPEHREAVRAAETILIKKLDLALVSNYH